MRYSIILALFLPLLSQVSSAPTPLTADDQSVSKRTADGLVGRQPELIDAAGRTLPAAADSAPVERSIDMLEVAEVLRRAPLDISEVKELPGVSDWRRATTPSLVQPAKPQGSADWKRTTPTLNQPAEPEGSADWKRSIVRKAVFNPVGDQEDGVPADWRRSDSNVE